MTLSRFWRGFLGEPRPETGAPGDLDHRLTRLALAGRTRVGSRWGGAYRSAFRGQGLEFAGVREYQAGDDTRTLDWRVWARTGTPAVRRYTEERDRRVWLLVDVGAAAETGSGAMTLRHLAGEVSALLATAAVAAGDRVGLLAWSERREVLLPPRRDRTAVARLVRALLEAPACRRTWNAAAALADLRRLAPRPSVLTVVSPLMADPAVVAGSAALARKHHLLLVRTWDARAGCGRSTARIPGRGAGGDRGEARCNPPPSLPPLPGRVVTVMAGEDASVALGRALERPVVAYGG